MSETLNASNEHPFPLNILNSWPLGSNGRHQDNLLIHKMYNLGTNYGHDYLAEVCAEIERVWRANHMVEGCTVDQLQGLSDNRPLLSILKLLCDEHGYGRIPQLAKWMADVLLRPNTIPEHQKFYNERMVFLEEAKRHYHDQPRQEN